MKIELPESVAKQLRGPLADCANNGELSPSVLAGEVRGGCWDEGGTDKVFLFLAAIRPQTARKIRRLIEKERN
jgi:hypothetical protein